MGAPELLTTERLLLRRPEMGDAAAIFERYASDPEVVRYLSWPRHRSLEDTRAFLAHSEAEWARGPAGPYLIFSRAEGTLLGGTGLSCETPERAETGYVLARDAWGRGYATEVLRAMVALAPAVGLSRLYAICHPEQRVSCRVLEKCGFELEGTLRRRAEFPNLEPGVPLDVLRYSLPLGR